MKILDWLIDEMNNDLETQGKEGKIERLHTEPVEIVETSHGTRHRDIKTGQFIPEIEKEIDDD